MSDSSTGRVLDYIPDEVPPRSVTSVGVNYPAADSAKAPWAEGNIRIWGEPQPLSDYNLDGLPLTEVRLYDDIDWDEIDMAVVANMPNGWQTLLLVTLVEENEERFLEGVSIPTQTFVRGEFPPQWRSYLAGELRKRVQAGTIDVVEGNIETLLSWADEVY